MGVGLDTGGGGASALGVSREVGMVGRVLWHASGSTCRSLGCIGMLSTVVSVVKEVKKSRW